MAMLIMAHTMKQLFHKFHLNIETYLVNVSTQLQHRRNLLDQIPAKNQSTSGRALFRAGSWMILQACCEPSSKQ